MKDNLTLVSYTLAVMSGICFVGGFVILNGERIFHNGSF